MTGRSSCVASFQGVEKEVSKFWWRRTTTYPFFSFQPLCSEILETKVKLFSKRRIKKHGLYRFITAIGEKSTRTLGWGTLGRRLQTRVDSRSGYPHINPRINYYPRRCKISELFRKWYIIYQVVYAPLILLWSKSNVPRRLRSINCVNSEKNTVFAGLTYLELNNSVLLRKRSLLLLCKLLHCFLHLQHQS